MIAGLDSTFGGQITRPPSALAMVFKIPRLLPWWTLAQNITLAYPACTPGRARALLDAVGLAAAADLHPEKASLGLQRRAPICRHAGFPPHRDLTAHYATRRPDQAALDAVNAAAWASRKSATAPAASRPATCSASGL